MSGGPGSGGAGVIALALALAACAEAPREAGETRAPVEVEAALDRPTATTGDLVTYTLTVDHDAGVEVRIPEAGAEIAGLHIVDAGREGRPRKGAGRVVERRWYRLRADLVGSYVLPPVVVAYRPAVDASGTGGEGEAPEAGTAGEEDAGEDAGGAVEAPEVRLEVESVLPADGSATDIRDVKPLREMEDPSPWPWIAAGAAALALAAGALLWLRRRRRERPAAPPAPPHEVALAALDALERADLFDLAAVRRYHFRVSEVVRAYVEARFGLNATDLTTDEILPGLARLRLARPEEEGLTAFLLATDRVKFAAHAPAPEEVRRTHGRARSFVEATRPAPEAASGGETAVGRNGGAGSGDAASRGEAEAA